MSFQSAEAAPDGQSTADAQNEAPTGSFIYWGQDPRPLSYVLEGWPLPAKCPPKSWEDHAAALRKLPLRDDDIFVLAFPKAGVYSGM